MLTLLRSVSAGVVEPVVVAGAPTISRTPLEAPDARIPASAKDPTPQDIADRASRALAAELETYPKPGLVSLVDSGSHGDMDASTFRRSAAAIGPFFAKLAEAGTGGADLPTLRAIGLEAEAAMLAATGGVNTHRGAIFALGLLSAAAGAEPGAGASRLAAHVRERWGASLSAERPGDGSHGARAMRRFGVAGARGEAAAGFPTAIGIGLPALRGARAAAKTTGEAKRSGASRATDFQEISLRDEAEDFERAARVEAFFALLAALDDTNLLHRGGESGLLFAREAAAAFLETGGVGRSGWLGRAVTVHRAFVARRLSPGGTADLLAVTLFLDAADGAVAERGR